ncbi:MAG: ribonuclease E inhibitor RraB [Pyrinomonadaceae bacterium]|nr:ribonuclease E inhibitor RraB [Pyrinomonadaceae bacterium]
MDFKDKKSQLEGIEEIFAEAKRVDNWNMDEEMLYSYYFIDKDVDKLEELGNFLEEKGYDFMDIFELGDDETEEPTGEFLLHIDKEEVHTPETLAARNAEFAKLAEERGLMAYDGWEFGEVGVYDEDELDDDIIE